LDILNEEGRLENAGIDGRKMLKSILKEIWLESAENNRVAHSIGKWQAGNLPTQKNSKF
jgi:cellobiose-specific phosphotransferase system component IIC